MESRRLFKSFKILYLTEFHRADDQVLRDTLDEMRNLSNSKEPLIQL